MAFSSVQFLFVFLPLSLAVYWLCPKWLRNAVLAAFSLLFFAWAGLKGAAILVLLAGINWLGGLSLGRLAHKRPLLILLILLDLAVLGGFKYAGFAAETVNALVPGLLPVLSPALPAGAELLRVHGHRLLCRCGRGQGGIGKEPYPFCGVPRVLRPRAVRAHRAGTASRLRSWTQAARRAASRRTASATASSGSCWAWQKRPSSPTSSL